VWVRASLYVQGGLSACLKLQRAGGHCVAADIMEMAVVWLDGPTLVSHCTCGYQQMLMGACNGVQVSVCSAVVRGRDTFLQHACEPGHCSTHGMAVVCAHVLIGIQRIAQHARWPRASESTGATDAPHLNTSSTQHAPPAVNQVNVLQAVNQCIRNVPRTFAGPGSEWYVRMCSSEYNGLQSTLGGQEQ
jgi:hypothetical protein